MPYLVISSNEDLLALREFCRACNRPAVTCFCQMVLPFKSQPAQFALIVHPYEARSTVGTAWILRRSIANLRWFRSKGRSLDADAGFLEALRAPATVPLLLYPGGQAFNLSQASDHAWQGLVPGSRRPLFFVLDGTWSQATIMLRDSPRLRSLPRVSFDPVRASEYAFKTQPRSACLSSVEGVYRVIELLAARGWGTLPEHREHDRMMEIFRKMVGFQVGQGRDPRTGAPAARRSQDPRSRVERVSG